MTSDDSTPAPPSRPVLAYGRADASRRRRPLRWMAALLLLAGVWAEGYWHSWLCLRGRNWYWQRQCLNYAPPADRVVYEADPQAAGALIARGGDYSAAALQDEPPGTRVAVYQPGCWDRLEIAQAELRPAMGGGGIFGSLSGGVPPTPPPSFTLFLSERKTTAHERRLVRITADQRERRILSLSAHVYIPGTLDMPELKSVMPITPSPVTSAYRGLAIPDYFETLEDNPFSHGPWLYVQKFRFFAGQADAGSDSHFTIAFDADGQRGLIDGWLLYGDKIRLSIRSGNPPQEFKLGWHDPEQ